VKCMRATHYRADPGLTLRLCTCEARSP
jgi:hypothetical protein